MPRWIKQRDLSSCGPVCLLNLQKWLGYHITYAKDYPIWKEKCCSSNFGSPLNCFVASLYSVEGIKIIKKGVPNIEIIDEYLLENCAIVMKSAYIQKEGKEKGELTGHYFLITERRKNSFFCVNEDDKHCWINKNKFEAKWLQNYPYYCNKCGIAPYAWIIKNDRD